MDPALQIEGGRKLRRAFKEVGDDMSDLKDLHKRLADDVAGTAKTKVPVRSGRLRNSNSYLSMRASILKPPGAVLGSSIMVPMTCWC